MEKVETSRPLEHIPVMLAEAVAALAIKADGTYLDGTFGRGGHARAVLQQLGPKGRLLLMDRDPEAIAQARVLEREETRVALRQGSFAEMGQWGATAAGLDGVLLDLGVSSPQLDDAQRGFSFQADAPLDMRMDPTSGESAAQFLARASETDIADVLTRGHPVTGALQCGNCLAIPEFDSRSGCRRGHRVR